MLDIAKEKHPELTVFEGDFLTYPVLDTPVNTIVSTYAFHHLTDDEKAIAVKQFKEILKENGKIVFGDTMFASEIEKQAMIDSAKEKGFSALAEDLQREYYPIIDTLEDIFTTNGFDIEFKQMNHFVWIITAIKNKE
jgi:putative AdoMet-dependent methyltransferase